MIDLYRTLFRTSLAVQLQYRASGIIWMLGGVVEPVVFLVVWSTVAAAGGGEVGTYTPPQFAAYYLTLMVVDMLTFTWVMHEFEWRIREGQFNALLLRPVHPIHSDIADNLAYKVLVVFVILPAALVLSLLFRPEFSTPPWAFAAAIPVLILSLTVRFFIGWTLALAAFWTTRTTAINSVYFAITLLVSGRIAPIELLPDVLRGAAAILPFYYTNAFSAELLIGRVTPEELRQGVMMQVLWVALAAGLLRLLWGRATRRYGAVGG